MQILYTGADKHLKVQPDPAKSLGGYVSSSLLPNGGLNNLFPAIDRDDVKRNLVETRLIVLKTSVAMTGVRVWTEKGTLTSYQLAVVTPALVNSEPVFEQIVDRNSIPYQATLAAKEGEPSALSVGNLDANVYVGIWIQRTLDLTAFTELDGKPGVENLTDDQLEALLLATSTPLDQTNLIIDWS